MKKPRRVKVGAHWYRIIYKRIEASASGFCYRVAKKIEISDKLAGSYLAETLLHETMHAVWYEWGVVNSEMPMEAYAAGVATEEHAINGLANGLMAVFRDNPQFRAFIMAGVR